MILLDTNVVSEALRPAPVAQVLAWLDAQALETLYLPAMAVAELRAGVAFLPSARRRNTLATALETRVLPLFVGRVLPFDLACTRVYADLLATARRLGRGIDTADACIAAVALANGFSIASRDTGPFAAAGLRVINPWQATA